MGHFTRKPSRLRNLLNETSHRFEVLEAALKIDSCKRPLPLFGATGADAVRILSMVRGNGDRQALKKRK